MAGEPSRGRPSAAHGRNPRTRARVRAIVAIMLLVAWSVSALSGFLLYAEPKGPRSGWAEILFLTKSGWGEVHFWVSVAAIVITVVHLLIDRKALKSCARFLVSTERGQAPRE